MSSLVPINNYGLPSEHEMAVFNTMAKQAVSSRMYRNIGDESGVMMIMLSAREFGIPAMQALNGGINIINGKVELSARMIGALIRRAGHEIKVTESTQSSCTLVGKRRGGGTQLQVSYTLEEAQKAGIVKPGGGWTRNPLDMCYARALSRLARQLFPDVIGIGYVQGEISGDVETSSGPLEDEPCSFIETEQPLSEEDLLEKYVNIFTDADDKAASLTYLKVLMVHFGWSRRHALEKLVGSPQSVIEAFHKWKNRGAKEISCAS